MHVTEAACQALSNLLGRRGPDRCLRLTTVHGNYRFLIDDPIDQDIIFQHAERTVLVVSDTVSRDLWGITVDCADDNGKRKLIFRKAKGGEPFDVPKKDVTDDVPPAWRAGEHERLLGEIAEIGKQIKALRGGSKSSLREQLGVLEARKHQKWDAIRALWAGDGGWHKRNNGAGNGTTNGATAIPAKAAD